jgi:hypothetical protein
VKPLPQDLRNLLAFAIRDVIWIKEKVVSFLTSCGVPESIMVEVRRMRKEKETDYTLKFVHHALDRLAAQGEDGHRVAREILTQMHQWKDIHTVKADRKDQAIASLQALQAGVNKFRSQAAYQQEQQKRERAMHKEREDRGRMSSLDHAKLAGFRDEFDRIAMLDNRQDRGNEVEKLMNGVFAYYCEKSKGSVRRTGEQIDGHFYFDKHWWYVEVRWKEILSNAADITTLRGRAVDAFGGDTKALFLSINGFSSECLESLVGRTQERVILMDGMDLRCVLDCQIAFDVLLAEKQAEIVKGLRTSPLVSARDIIAKRSRPTG